MLIDRSEGVDLWSKIAFVNLMLVLAITFLVFGVFQNHIPKILICFILIVIIFIKIKPVFKVFMRDKVNIVLFTFVLILQVSALVFAKGVDIDLIIYLLVFFSTGLIGKYLAKQLGDRGQSKNSFK